MMHVYNNAHDIPIKSVLTDNGVEFTTHHKSKNHRFERLLADLKITHRLTKVRHPWTNGACERLQRTSRSTVFDPEAQTRRELVAGLEEFYQVAFRTRFYETLEPLNDDLHNYLNTYNCQRTHHGKRTAGSVPAALYLLHKKSA